MMSRQIEVHRIFRKKKLRGRMESGYNRRQRCKKSDFMNENIYEKQGDYYEQIIHISGRWI